MDRLGLGARVRRKESLSVLKQRDKKSDDTFIGYGSESHLPSDTNVPPEVDELQKFRDELFELDRKKQEHLTVKRPKGGGLVRWSTLLVILLFAISGGLFFFGGYLYSYKNPPTGVATGPVDQVLNDAKDTDWRIGTVIESPAPPQPTIVPDTYMARRQVIERNEALSNNLYGDATDRANQQARREAKKIVNRSARNITYKIRDIFGPTVSRIFAPFARTVIDGTVGKAVDQGLPVGNRQGSSSGQAQSQMKGMGYSKPQSSSARSSTAQKGLFTSGGGAGSSTGNTNSSSTSSGGLSSGSSGFSGSGASSSSSTAGSFTSGSSGSVGGSTEASDGGDGQSSLESAQEEGVPIKAEDVGNLFALELQTFIDSADAFQLLRTLREQGYSASYIVRATSGQDVVFKVRIGNFATYSDASKTSRLLEHPSRVVLATRYDEPLSF